MKIKKLYQAVWLLSIWILLFSCVSSSSTREPAVVETTGDAEYLENIDFVIFNKRGMVIRREVYEYSGGAHGMGAVQYLVIDLADKRLLKLDDFFREGTEERLYSILVSALRSYNNSHSGTVLEDNQGLSQGIFFTDNPALTENFFIANDGLGLNWDRYEIAPFYAGSIEVILPWRTIRPLLKHEMMELLEKFGIYMFMD